MSSIAIHHNAWVLIGDGCRALFFVNHGDAELLDLRVIETRIDQNPATRDQGSDAPGRNFSSKGGVRSALDNMDWHEVEEECFANHMAQKINQETESEIGRAHV